MRRSTRTNNVRSSAQDLSKGQSADSKLAAWTKMNASMTWMQMTIMPGVARISFASNALLSGDSLSLGT